jgi:hypothetical protein
MEVWYKLVEKEPFKLVAHLQAQCEVCGSIVRTSNRARHKKTVKHWQAKTEKDWTWQYVMVPCEIPLLEN